MDIFMFILGGFFIFIGYGISKLKWDFLIAGYNTSSKEEKARVDIVKVRRRMGIMLYAMGGLFILNGLLEESVPVISTIVPIAVVIIALGSIVWINIGTTLKGQNINGEAFKETKSKKRVVISVIGSIILFMIIVGVMLFSTTQDIKIDINNDNKTMYVSGNYSETIKLEDINSVEILDKLPKMGLKTNGAGVGDAKFGSYKLKDGGEKVTLHITNETKPCILLKMKDGKKDVYINKKNEENTMEIYEELVKNLNK